MPNFIDFQKHHIESGKQHLAENIKLLLYKLNSDIFEIVDYENDDIYLEPLFFAFFNSEFRRIEDLDLILLATRAKSRKEITAVQSDNYGRIYLPKIGWIITDTMNFPFQLQIIDDKIDLQKNGTSVNYEIEPAEFINGTSIELLKYPVSLLNQCYFDVDTNLIDVEIVEITKAHRDHITTAFGLIKECLPEHFQFIEATTSKVVIFNVDTYLRNSFASITAQGIGFFNACQDIYNEVFFVDDIAHQTGHVIFNAMIYEVENFIRVPRNLILETIPLPNGHIETRDLHVLFHALYTYYTTFICLDACLDKDVFAGLKKVEALARMAFYIEKCYNDLKLVEKPINKEHTSERLFTTDGLIIYNQIKRVFTGMVNKWGSVVQDFEMTNQPYNFSFSIFLESNPLNDI